MNYPLTKTYTAEGTTGRYLIVKQGTADGKILTADAAAGTLGVVSQPGQTISAGEVTDVVLLGETEVVLGGDVSAGASITSDANGKAVTANTGERSVGIALMSGESDEVVRCLVSPHTA